MFFERLSVLCFAGTYGLALAADLTRFAVRTRPRWDLTVGLTALGWIVHTAFLANLAWRVQSLPISTAFQSLLVLAWILAGIALYLLLSAPKPAAFGMFVLLFVLALVAVAGMLPPQARTEWTSLGGWKNLWGVTHGILLLLGVVSTCVAFAAGLMYLAQAHRLKHKRAPRFGFALPSLELSERWNRWAITLAFPLLTFGLIIGVALNLATQQERGESVLRWSDPKVVFTVATWVVFAALLHARYRPEWQGQRVMLLTVVAFGFMIFTLVGVDLLLPTAHGVAMAPGGRP
ncbi:c-type cytochrome biogenesis protein CcsB [soil metagenome]